MKRLYQITDTNTKQPVPALYFAAKPAAKEKRRELNEATADSERLRFIVSPGPDHKNFKRKEN